ncbi:Crp/Fnr family transcriptional regulator [Bradyrhizobium cenepequi]
MPLRRELQAIVDLRGAARVLHPGAELYSQGESCNSYFIVLSSWVALSTLLSDGDCLILDFALPGAFLGLPLISRTRMYHSARCLTPVQVCAYRRPLLQDIVEHNPKLACLLCRWATFEEARTHDHLINLGLRSARERIAHLILELYVRFHGRAPARAGETLELPLTQAHIGQATGLTGVHVSRTFRTLREQGIVRLANHNVEILDPAALMRAAGLEHETGYDHGPKQHRERFGRYPRIPSDTDWSPPVGWLPNALVA